MDEDEDIGFDEDDEDNMEDEWDPYDDEYEDEYYEEYDDEYYNEEDEWGADEENDNDYSIDNLVQPSIDDQESQDDFAKDFMASDYSSVIPYDRKDPIVTMAAPTRDDIAEARNHYETRNHGKIIVPEIMVRSTTV